MAKINWGRLIVGGLIATVILFVADGMLHERVLHGDWDALYTALGARTPTSGHSTDLVYFFIFELGRGMIGMLMYVLMRAFYGAGPKTAIIAGLATWLAFSVTGPAQFIPLGFYSTALWAKVAGAHLVMTIIGLLAGAALYKDVAGSETT